ncbi:GerAB/ArcD/ProY family transporter [Bacillus sp. FJAT-27251]|uniref:GerAB/ArcD/ProY family transporter n=1 Tax=Bacillus sp. FJAT-27251 TaxID=1684142 RepID=UPI0006A7BBFE|nr:GerAB/ArcD/ProY family transporter [Bacillus sp. FJAT-27251]
MNSNVKENKMVSPYFLFYLMHSPQTGVVILSFQTDIIKGAGHNAWLSVLATGLLMHVLFLMMLYILKHSSAGNLLSFHRDVFGKFFGGMMNLIMAIYFSILSLYTLYTYIDVLQIWVFDGISSWEFSLLFSFVIFYIVAGGFRVITAVAYWGVVIPSFLLFSLLYLFNYIEFSYLSPIFDSGWKDYFISAKEAAPLYIGFETVLIFFPFIKGREKASKWGHLGLLYSTFVYTVVSLITFLFFTQEKLKQLAWPTLTMIKIMQFPFLERFEFIFIFTWLLVIMPVICIYMWSAIRSIKWTFPKLKSTHLLVGLLALFHFVNSKFADMQYGQLIAQFVRYNGLLFLFGYVPFLFLIAVVRKKMSRKKH